MNELQHLEMFATKLHEEEPSTILFVPLLTRNMSHFHEGGYVCRDNGIGCGKAFPTREAKNRHRQWCQRVKQCTVQINTFMQ